MNTLYPLFLKFEELPILIVGGGNVALEKLNSILKSSPKAKVTILAPEIIREVECLASEFSINLIKDSYNKTYLNLAKVVFATTDSFAINKQVKIEANAINLLVNVADTPELCDFYLGSVVSKGDLKLGISTNGMSPTFAKRFREVLEAILPDTTQDTLDNLKSIRDQLKGDFTNKVNELNKITQNMIKK